MADHSVFSKFDHVGILVRDMDKAIEHLQSLGIGPFKPFSKQVVRYDTKLYGKAVDPAEIQLVVRLAEIGEGVKIEMIQPLAGGPWGKFVDETGGGMHHLAFTVDDVDKAKAELVEKGATVLYEGKFEGGGAAAYLDTTSFGDLVDVIEVVKWVPGMMPF